MPGREVVVIGWHLISMMTQTRVWCEKNCAKKLIGTRFAKNRMNAIYPCLASSNGACFLPDSDLSHTAILVSE